MSMYNFSLLFIVLVAMKSQTCIIESTNKLKHIGNTMKLSKTTYNTAKRYNVELCNSIKNELHFIIDPEKNDCASVAYKLEKSVYKLDTVWDKNMAYPSILKDEKALRDLIKLIVK